jgi:hypothetical protein
MSGSRLLIDIEVLELLRTCKRKQQENLLKRFREIASHPSNYSDFAEYDSSARRVDVHIYDGFAIKFWDDFADRHVKILEIHSADLF